MRIRIFLAPFHKKIITREAFSANNKYHGGGRRSLVLTIIDKDLFYLNKAIAIIFNHFTNWSVIALIFFIFLIVSPNNILNISISPLFSNDKIYLIK